MWKCYRHLASDLWIAKPFHEWKYFHIAPTIEFIGFRPKVKYDHQVLSRLNLFAHDLASVNQFAFRLIDSSIFTLNASFIKWFASRMAVNKLNNGIISFEFHDQQGEMNSEYADEWCPVLSYCVVISLVDHEIFVRRTWPVNGHITYAPSNQNHDAALLATINLMMMDKYFRITSSNCKFIMAW